MSQPKESDRPWRHHWALSPIRKLWQCFYRVYTAPRRVCARLRRYDLWRLCQASWVKRALSRETRVAEIVVHYHVVEKGLTMPGRRLNFGHAMVTLLARQCLAFQETFGVEGAPQVRHAIAVLRAYAALHDPSARAEAPAFWADFGELLARLPEVPPATQPHVTREAFFAAVHADFEAFARSRHTLRHYAGPLPIERVRAAVALACETAPSACNRQHARVRCVSDPALRDRLLALQNGNRGFGHLADKVLVVSADCDDLLSPAERNDAYVNGGIFLMNLCYALHYHQIAHCMLNWSVSPETDRALRALIPIRESEIVLALLTCGEAPECFDVAMSPRRPVAEMYTEV